MKNSYMSIALSDYKYLENGRCIKSYMHDVELSCRVVEKVFKEVIQDVHHMELGKQLVKNLEGMYCIIKEHFTLSERSENYLSTMTELYRNIGYPGSNFREYSEEEAVMSYVVATEVIEKAVFSGVGMDR